MVMVSLPSNKTLRQCDSGKATYLISLYQGYDTKELGPMKVLNSGNDRPKNEHIQVKNSVLDVKIS